MFGMGGSEIIVILIVALLFLGPDKLPEAAKSISKGIRDLRKQTRDFQQSIEADEKIGGAIKDLQSALRGDELRARPRPARPEALPGAIGAAVAAGALDAPPSTTEAGAMSTEVAPPVPAAGPTLPPTAGEPAASAAESPDPDDEQRALGELIKPASGTVAKGSVGATNPDDV